MAAWVPLRQRREEGKEVLYPDVPPWLYPSLAAWAEERIAGRGPEPLRRIVRVLTWDVEPDAHLWSEFQRRLREDEELLDIVNYFLKVEGQNEYGHISPAVVEMVVILSEAGSAWTVGIIEEDRGDGQPRWGLMERLPAEVSEAVESVASAADRSGEHLRSARAHLYGRGPNPTEAYRDAVRAVEAAGKPVVSPKNSKTTVGTIKADIRQAPEGKFRFAIQGREESDPRDTVVAMLGLLYSGQHDRHGNPEAPGSVSQEEAEAAFHLAVTLVHWFRSGAISQGSP